MQERYTKEQMWTIPTQGTWGKKAENLYKNTQTILGCGFEVPHSLVIPFEYFQNTQGPGYWILDDIQKEFPDCEFVAVRSNSPDEDLGERTPGLYTSAKLPHHNRRDCYESLERVLGSYFSREAKERRKKLGLEEKGMSLLVQEWVPALNSGCFSYLGYGGVLMYTNPTKGIESMIKPSLRKLTTDKEGKIKAPKEGWTTDEEAFTRRLMRLINHLPQVANLGWELEFVRDLNMREYILQTTPIKKQERFQVTKRRNIFQSSDVIGTGLFRTNGILYLPSGFISGIHELHLEEFDSAHKDYCLVTNRGTVITGARTCGINPLPKIHNAKSLLCVSPSGYFESVHSFASHVATEIREREMCALSGKFTGKLANQMSGADSDNNCFYLETKLLIQADEIEQEANVEVVQ